MPDSLEMLRGAHAERRAACDLLEALANALPEVQPPFQLYAAELLEKVVALHHADDENALFPFLRQFCPDDVDVEPVIESLQEDHRNEEMMAFEVRLYLVEAASNRLSVPHEALGYALRGLFDAQRRHLEWEEMLLVPLANRHLGRDAQRCLARIMRRNRAIDDGTGCDGSCLHCSHALAFDFQPERRPEWVQ